MDPDRYLPFSAVFNFRDLGGYATADGRRVRRGVVYRADGLFRLTADDIERFGALRLRNVIDLRRPAEIAANGRIPVLDGLTYHHICLQQDAWTTTDVPADALAGFLSDRYTEIAEESAVDTGPLGAVLRMIADEAAGPTVFHCSAGKDRTGVVAALILGLLKVPDETIAEDYAASRLAETRYLAWRAVHRPDLPPLTRADDLAPAGAILDFLSRLRTRYGSVRGYLARAGVAEAHCAALADRLLTEPTS